MKTLALSLASLVLVASAGLASAEPANPQAQIVRPGVAIAAPIVEGRQTVAIKSAGSVGPAEAYVIDRNVDTTH